MRALSDDLLEAIQKVFAKYFPGEKAYLTSVNMRKSARMPGTTEFTLEGMTVRSLGASPLLGSPYGQSPPLTGDIAIDPYGNIQPQFGLDKVTEDINRRLTKKSHDGHEVVENVAGGQTFRYCRNCKEEVT